MKSNNHNYDFILAIDQGGHASRARIYTLNGDIETSATCNIETQHLYKHGVEYIQHSVKEIVQSIEFVISECAKYLGDTRKFKIKAGFATQRSTIVCWNYKTGEILSDAISWQDTRASSYIKNFITNNDLIKSKTGLFLSAHYGVSKIKWCLDNLETIQQAFQDNELCIAPLSSYLLFSFIEGSRRLVDPANAARTLLLNQNTLDWDEDLLKLFSIPKSVLPECVASKYDYGKLSNWDGICDVQICTGDQSSAVFSQGLPQNNHFIVNIGSGAFVLNINKKSVAPARILSGCIYTDNLSRINAWEGTVNGAGTALDWLQKKYTEVNIYQQLPDWLENKNEEIPLFINGISGVGSPYWITALKSRFIGEALLPAKAIAVVESIVFLISENINLMKTESVNFINISGGLSILDGLCQKLSNLTELEVTRSQNKEATLSGLFFLLSESKLNYKIKNNEKFHPTLNQSLSDRFINWKKVMANE
ncbi:MAG: FGGY family carbohydrate kinase [Thiohalomonadales bacterium]